MDIVQLCFWLCIALIIYVYIGYYGVLWILLAILGEKRIAKGPLSPSITHIIPVHNEAGQLPEKIANSLAIDYDSALLQTIIASDGCTDNTAEICQQYPRVELSQLTTRGGKNGAIRHALQSAKGEIIVISDAGVRIDKEAFANIASNFNDKQVGAVSCRDVVGDRDGKTGEGIYVKYEMALRQMESRFATLIGMSGCLFGVRKEIARQFYETGHEYPEDAFIPFLCAKMGMRTIMDRGVIARYHKKSREEFQRKVRTCVFSLHMLLHNLDMLNPFRYGRFAWQMFSHKLLRRCVPFFAIAVFVVNVYLCSQESLRLFYGSLLVLQVLFYSIACLGMSAKLHKRKWILIPHYFSLANIAIMCAWSKYCWLYCTGKNKNLHIWRK